MDYYTHDGVYLIGIGSSNILPEPEDGVFVVAGRPEGFHRPPEGFGDLRFRLQSQQWEDPRSQEQRESDAANAARYKRNRLLDECDWTQMSDVPLENKDALAAYRQALRDLPEQPGFPEAIAWPDAPEET